MKGDEVIDKPLTKLFSPIKIGTMELGSRIALAPMDTNYANRDGTVSEQYQAYIEARAKGGAGLLILEVTSIDGKYPYVPNTVGMWDDKQIAPMRGLTDAIHAYGAKLIPQISHPGPSPSASCTRCSPWGLRRSCVSPIRPRAGNSRWRRSATLSSSSAMPPGGPENPAATASSCTQPTATCCWGLSSRRCGTSGRTPTAARSSRG